MTLKTLKQTLETTHLPVAYKFFPESVHQDPPCITYEVASKETFPADGAVYKRFLHIVIDLWLKAKSETTEASLEGVLTSAGLVWEMVSEEYDEDARVYDLTYEVTLDGE